MSNEIVLLSNALNLTTYRNKVISSLDELPPFDSVLVGDTFFLIEGHDLRAIYTKAPDTEEYTLINTNPFEITEELPLEGDPRKVYYLKTTVQATGEVQFAIYIYDETNTKYVLLGHTLDYGDDIAHTTNVSVSDLGRTTISPNEYETRIAIIARRSDGSAFTTVSHFGDYHLLTTEELRTLSNVTNPDTLRGQVTIQLPTNNLSSEIPVNDPLSPQLVEVYGDHYLRLFNIADYPINVRQRIFENTLGFLYETQQPNTPVMIFQKDHSKDVTIYNTGSLSNLYRGVTDDIINTSANHIPVYLDLSVSPIRLRAGSQHLLNDSSLYIGRIIKSVDSNLGRYTIDYDLQHPHLMTDNDPTYTIVEYRDLSLYTSSLSITSPQAVDVDGTNFWQAINAPRWSLFPQQGFHVDAGDVIKVFLNFTYQVTFSHNISVTDRKLRITAGYYSNMTDLIDKTVQAPTANVPLSIVDGEAHTFEFEFTATGSGYLGINFQIHAQNGENISVRIPSTGSNVTLIKF